MGPSSESESDRTSSHSESEPCDANSAAAIAGAAAAGLSTAPAPISRTPDEARAVSAAGSASSHFPAAAAAVPGSTDAQGVVSPAAPQPPPTEPDGALMAPRSAMSSMPEQTAIASSPWILASFSRNRSSDGSHGLGRDVWARLLTSEGPSACQQSRLACGRAPASRASPRRRRGPRRHGAGAAPRGREAHGGSSTTCCGPSAWANAGTCGCPATAAAAAARPARPGPGCDAAPGEPRAEPRPCQRWGSRADRCSATGHPSARR
eukprot:scaffold31707_cov124-Isochrysis_galbana.AAC.2